MKELVRTCLEWAHTPRTRAYKLASLAVGALLFLVLLPGLLLGVFHALFPEAAVLPSSIRLIPGAGLTLAGLALMGWATWYQWRLGRGTPAVNAPTEQLVTTGPYALCRNPLQLGAITYYAGLALAAHSLAAGLFCFAAGLILALAWVKGLEEKELGLRFGAAYTAYKQRTPMLLPWPRKPRQ